MTEVDKKKSALEDEMIETYSITVLFSELLFALLPFAVVFLVYAYKEVSWRAYVMAPEWAFAAAVLFGQTIVKFVQATSLVGPRVIAERVGLVVSLLIVAGLVPSMVLLGLLLASTSPPLWIGILQIVFALIAGIIFLGIGAASHEEAMRSTVRQRRIQN